MLKRKVKNTIIISIALVVMVAVIVAFYFVILYTPNLNSQINIKANNVLGSVAINIKNADNGSPFSYFDFENTTQNDKTHKMTNKNLLFKSDESKIIIELAISNMSYYKTNVDFNISGPGKNGKIEYLIDNVEMESFTNLVIDANTTKSVSYVISKENIKKPLRGKITIDVTITKYETII